MKKFFVSATMGVLSLLLINLTSFITGISLAVNLWTIAISSVLGISSVIAMITLSYLI